jgi:Fungal protein of unknown function (DUF2011)
MCIMMTVAPAVSGDGTAGEEDETFEFRLFASKPKPKLTNANNVVAKDPGLVRVTIRSPTPLSAHGDGGLVVPFRPRGYYFSRDDKKWQRKSDEYADVAVTGAEVVEKASRKPWVCLFVLAKLA